MSFSRLDERSVKPLIRAYGDIRLLRCQFLGGRGFKIKEIFFFYADETMKWSIQATNTSDQP